MADVLTPEQRHLNMSRNRGKDTKPELLVRQYLHARGLRYRLHSKELPGKPDIVLPRYKTIVFVHGCFWHRHSGCRYTTTPGTRTEFWVNKFARNVENDDRQQAELTAAGWKVLTVWECELKATVREQNLGNLLAKIIGEGT